MSRTQILMRRRNDELNGEINERLQAEQRLAQLAHYDSITGLANRVLFRQRLVQAIESVVGQRSFLAVMILDIDGFKSINDTLGHAMGDLLLRHATQRFVDSVHGGDTVARLGGDEFGFILQHLEHPEDAVHVVGQLLRSLALPFDLNGNAALVTASIGVAICPLDGSNAEDLLRHADTAMYSAKESGRNDFRFYQAAMTQQIKRRVDMEHALRRALGQGEFEVWYQPRLNLSNGQLEGAEALLRWRDPQLGLIMPSDFIPLAERTGQIIAIGEWVLDQACQHIRDWRAQGCLIDRVAVNVAAPQIERSDFVGTVRAALSRHQLPGEALEVEVTESLLLESHEAASGVLRELQSMGVATAIDDFGTGYSSMAYLKRLPIDHLKVDQAFIRDLPNDQGDVAIVQAIIALKRAMNFRMTAEGIETRAQYEFLRDAGCDAGQGYFISRPLPAAEFASWLLRHGWPCHEEGYSSVHRYLRPPASGAVQPLFRFVSRMADRLFPSNGRIDIAARRSNLWTGSRQPSRHFSIGRTFFKHEWLSPRLIKESTMASIEEVLDSLDPPLKHSCERQGSSLRLVLTDPAVHQSVERRLTPRELQNSLAFQMVLLYAVNEIRGLGSHAKLEVLPPVDPINLD
jgi:diguanylate cyclase (GGDEF)-like protein